MHFQDKVDHFACRGFKEVLATTGFFILFMLSILVKPFSLFFLCTFCFL